MALTLVDQLSRDFDVKAYKDTYMEKLMKLIDAKAKGKNLVVPEIKAVHSAAGDLMEQLKAIVEIKEKLHEQTATI